MRPVDVCVAEGTHEAAKSDAAQWAQLVRLGVQDDGDGHAIELRNCDRCKTTLAVEVRS
jgi:hypothetical protein